MNRRGLFRLFAGAAAAPVVAKIAEALPAASAPAYENYGRGPMLDALAELRTELPQFSFRAINRDILKMPGVMDDIRFVTEKAPGRRVDENS